MKNYSLYFLLLLLFAANKMQANGNWKTLSENPEYLHRSIKYVTDVIVYDIYSPPVASRIYAYTTIAAYEAAATNATENYVSLAGQLHGLTTLPQPDSSKVYSYSLTSINALLLVAKAMVISEEKIGAFYNNLLQEFKTTGMPADVFQNSIDYGKKIADHIIAWAAKDNYKQTRSLSKYAVVNDAASWKPTPPSYMKAVEPHWSQLRTFLIDAAQQFKPLPPTPFSTDTNSLFYKEAKDVLNAGLVLTTEQKEIANFWDCNPFKMNVNGHVMYATKKISPGGHWINITQMACKKTGAGLVQSAAIYACLSITLADCFISCWDEKYRSKSIRPETYINQYISQSWVPLLQTPPFPEYTSGHSVISAGCAVVLSKFFGNNFAYSDSTEVEFQIPVRHFTSFKQAAQEAAISRFYGGIHYMPSITNGLLQGERIGKFVLERLKVKK
jgi:hypothetical protein